MDVIKNRIIDPFAVMKSDFKHSNYRLGIVRFFDSLLRNLPFSKTISKRKHDIIIKKLENDYSFVLDKYKKYNVETDYSSKSPVWVCWFQGIENAPPLVKICVNSIKKATNHPVNIISNDNIPKYIAFPDYILEKYNHGLITNAQYSDIVRMALLSEYGGLWIDATIFVPESIPEDVFFHEFYTCKRDLHSDSYISDYRWTSFLNGCQYGCVVQKAMCDLFFEYWKKENYLIDYLLVDYFMEVLYRNNPTVKRLVDELPYNNSMIDYLQAILNEEYNEKEYKELVGSDDTFLFKLSWRMRFEEETNNGKPTFFCFFIKNFEN